MTPEERRRQLADNLAETLTELPAAYDALRDMLQPSTRPGGVGGSSDPARLPLNADVVDLIDTREKRDTDPSRIPADRAADKTRWAWRDGRERWLTEPARLRQGVLPTLVQWCRLVDGELWDSGIVHPEYGLQACTGACLEAPVRARLELPQIAGPCSGNTRQHWTRPNVPDECGFLTEHLRWIADQPWLDEITSELHRLLAIIQVVTADTDIEYHCGACGWVIEGQDHDKHGKPSWYLCTGCRRAYSRASGEARLWQEQANYRTLGACAEATGVPLETLRRWVKSGWIAAVPGKDRRGKLYDVRRVRAVKAKTKPGPKPRSKSGRRRAACAA